MTSRHVHIAVDTAVIAAACLYLAAVFVCMAAFLSAIVAR
jgi:hypothetical protein